MCQRCVQSISNGKIDGDLIQIMLQDDEAENIVIKDVNSGLECTHPVSREDAVPRMASNVLNDVVESTNPAATLQSTHRISHAP